MGLGGNRSCGVGQEAGCNLLVAPRGTSNLSSLWMGPQAWQWRFWDRISSQLLHWLRVACLFVWRMVGLWGWFVCFPAFFTPIFWLMCKVDASCLKQGCKLLSLISSFARAMVLLEFLFVFPSCSNSCTAVGDAGCLIAVRQAEEISCPSVLSKERAVYSWWNNEKENQDRNWSVSTVQLPVTVSFSCFPRRGGKKCFKCMGDPGRTLAVLLTVVLIFPKSCHIQDLEYLNVKTALTTYDMRTLQEKSVRQMKSLIAEENGKYGNNLIAR